VVPIAVPPLRERRGDIPQLVRHFTDRLSGTGRAGLKPREFADVALKRLAGHDWPGNIRELRNAVERLLILATGDEVTETDAPTGATAAGAAVARRWRSGRSGPTFDKFARRPSGLLLAARAHDLNVSQPRGRWDAAEQLVKKIERYC
jgi:two-component system nitrogen regulation response regulator NtrX